MLALRKYSSAGSAVALASGVPAVCSLPIPSKTAESFRSLLSELHQGLPLLLPIPPPHSLHCMNCSFESHWLLLFTFGFPSPAVSGLLTSYGRSCYSLVAG